MLNTPNPPNTATRLRHTATTPDDADLLRLAQAAALVGADRVDDACALLVERANEAQDHADRAHWLLRRAEIEHEARGPTPAVEAALRQAVDAAQLAAENTDHATLFAHAALTLGQALLETEQPIKTQESIRWHQRAERVFRAAGDNEHAALCQINTAVAYLATPLPSGGPSRLRPKLAVQCLRAALAGLDRDTHPELWQTAVLNLANALQQCPSTPDAADLVEAVALYHELLSLRTADASARGRVLANLGCALGKLARFDDARRTLDQALACFDQDADAREGVLATLAEIDAAQAPRNTP